MKHTAAYVTLFGAFVGDTARTGHVSVAVSAVVLVLYVLLLVAEKFELLVYLCLPAQRKAIRKFDRAKRDAT